MSETGANVNVWSPARDRAIRGEDGPAGTSERFALPCRDAEYYLPFDLTFWNGPAEAGACRATGVQMGTAHTATEDSTGAGRLPASAYVPSLPAFDRAGALAGVDDDEVLLSALTGFFADEMGRRGPLLDEAVRAGNTTLVRLHCHHLCNAANLVGALSFGSLVHRMDLAARQGAWITVCRNLSEMEWERQLFLAVLGGVGSVAQPVAGTRGSKAADRAPASE